MKIKVGRESFSLILFLNPLRARLGVVEADGDRAFGPDLSASGMGDEDEGVACFFPSITPNAGSLCLLLAGLACICDGRDLFDWLGTATNLQWNELCSVVL